MAQRSHNRRKQRRSNGGSILYHWETIHQYLHHFQCTQLTTGIRVIAPVLVKHAGPATYVQHFSGPKERKTKTYVVPLTSSSSQSPKQSRPVCIKDTSALDLCRWKVQTCVLLPCRTSQRCQFETYPSMPNIESLGSLVFLGFSSVYW